MRVEYKILTLHSRPDASLEDQLNELGADGWGMRSANWQHSDCLDVILTRVAAPAVRRMAEPETTEAV